MISEEEREQRYKKLVIHLLGLAVKDILPNKAKHVPRKKLLDTNKRDATWFVFSSKGYRGLEWWCGLIGVSSLRVKRRVKEILK